MVDARVAQHDHGIPEEDFRVIDAPVGAELTLSVLASSEDVAEKRDQRLDAVDQDVRVDGVVAAPDPRMW
jgi:hypothetical protein